MPRSDSHHILHNRQEWSLRPEARRLRETRTLIPYIDRSVHNEIHATCPPVPALGYYALKLVESRFHEGSGTLQSMDNLMAAIEVSSRHPRSHQIERDLAQLAIQAIDLQRPIIAEALPANHLRLVI